MKAHDVDWTTVGFTKRSDREIQAALGCSLDSVKRARRALGFAPVGAPEPTTAITDWSKVEFGKEPDSVIAARIGCEVATVTRRRRDLGIAACVETEHIDWWRFRPCDECGVSDRQACRNDDDEVAERPCVGRPKYGRGGKPMGDGICPKGHAVEGHNAIIVRNGKRCRLCHNASAEASRKRRREQKKQQRAGVEGMTIKPTDEQRDYFAPGGVVVVGDAQILADQERALKDQVARLRNECAILLDAIVHAEAIFDNYTRHHRATGAVEKMERNEKHAEKMRAALRTAFKSAFQSSSESKG